MTEEAIAPDFDTDLPEDRKELGIWQSDDSSENATPDSRREQTSATEIQDILAEENTKNN